MAIPKAPSLPSLPDVPGPKPPKAPGSAAAARKPDIFTQLLPVKWREVEIPVTKMKMSLAHDLVEHKYWGVDGARVEATGLAPMRFHFSAPLNNGIVPGKNERWTPGSLYPGVLRKLMIAFAKKATGVLQHPEFGEIACKADKLDIDWSGDRRGGCEVELSFVETMLDGDTSFLEFPSPVQDILVAATDLDASNQDLLAIVPELPQYTVGFEDLARAVGAVFDQASLLSMRAAGKIDSIVYRCNSVSDSIDRAGSALTWPATQNIERLKSAAFGLREKLLAIGRAIVLYTVPGDTTLAGLAAQIADTSVADLIKLNPALMTSPVVRGGTMVRYYVSPLPI